MKRRFMWPLSFKISATIRYFFVGKLRAPITVCKLHIIVDNNS